MPKLQPVVIPAVHTVEQLRQHVVTALTRVSTRLAQTSTQNGPLSMGGNRLSDVPDPANPTDAVNLRTLKKAVQGIGQQRRQQQQEVGNPYYTLGWALNGTATVSMVVPGYPINPEREGTPQAVKLYARGTGGTTGINIAWVPSGFTGGTNILTSDLILGGSHGPVTSAIFISPLPHFNVNDVLYPVITTAGSASNITVTLLVDTE